MMASLRSSLRHPALFRGRALKDYLKGQEKSPRVLKGRRQLSIQSFSRRHGTRRSSLLPSSYSSSFPILTASTFATRCYSSCEGTTTHLVSPSSSEMHEILATSTNVPSAEPILAWYNPVPYVMDLANMIHESTGCSYAACIVVITTMSRCAILPLMISTQRNVAKGLDIRATLQQYSKTEPTQQALQEKRKALMKQYDYRPSQHLTLPLANIVLTCYMWFGIRSMSSYCPNELSTGGILWFTDLTQPDPLWLLPIMSGTALVLMFEVGNDYRQLSSKQRRLIRSLMIVIFPCFFVADASVNVFWTSNWFLNAVQDVAISQPTVREKLVIARTVQTNEKPIMFFQDADKEGTSERENKAVDTSSANQRNKKVSKKKKRKSPSRG